MITSPVSEIKDFLLLLDKDYGFQIDVARLESSLSCVCNITDLEEVLYRLQSMVCKNQQQIEQFQSLFAQHFLSDYLDLLSEDGSIKTTEDIIKELKTKLQELENKSRESTQIANQLAKDEEELRNIVENKSADLEKKIRKVNEALTGENKELIENTPALAMSKDERLEKRIKRLIDKSLAAMDDSESYLWNISIPKNRKMLKKAIDKALNTLDGILELEKYSSVYLKHASIKHDDPKAFKNLVGLSKALNNLVDVCKKSVGTKSINAAKSIKSAKNKIENGFENEKKFIEEKKEELERKQALLEKQVKRVEKNNKDIENKKAELSNIEEKSQNSELLIKASSKNHRDVFTSKNARAVQTTSDIKELLSTPLPYIKNADMQKMLTYIRTNSILFRQTLRRKMTVPTRHKIDIKNTLRCSIKTYGEPLRIKYKKPKKSHAKIVCLVDISGSCRAASSLALYFMAMMNEAFPGGCKKFAFVNHLVSVDKYFANCSAVDGVKAVNDNVPSRGIYSDYGKTIKELRDGYGGLFHKDTTVIILGDARNNMNYSSANDLKFIVDHSNKVFWLNPDNPQKWNQGDSIVDEYIKTGVEMRHVSTIGELLEFLMNESYNSSV